MIESFFLGEGQLEGPMWWGRVKNGLWGMGKKLGHVCLIEQTEEILRKTK